MKGIYIICLLALALALALPGCGSSKISLEKETMQSLQVLDSISEKVTKEVRVATTPVTTATQNLSLEQLEGLPVGGQYQAKDGNATATVQKKPDGRLVFTANCDSLTLLVESLTKEIYRSKYENSGLKIETKEEKAVEVNKLTGFQWFQIYGFRIYVLLTILFLGYKKFKN